MSVTVADHLLARLRDWGVENVFAYPGDGINGMLAAWGKAGDKPRFIQSRHEELSAFEAVGYAKLSGRVGVCAATSGPGAIHLLNGLYDAKLDHVPVVAIVGQTNRSAMGGAYQQEVDLLSLFKDVASDYCQMVTVPEQLPNVLDRAIRTAISRRSVTALIIPADVQELTYSAPGHEFKMVPSSLGMSHSEATPTQEELRKAADLLNAGSKPAILIGQGARHAVTEVIAVAETLGAGVAKALLGKDVLSDDLPYVTGSIGLLGTRPSYEMMDGCDTLLTIGSSFPYTQFMPGLDQARAVQIDIDPGLMDRQAHVSADPINPQAVVAELASRLPANAVVTTDSGSAANWYARQLKFGEHNRGMLSGTLATMGPGLPYAFGAKIARPDLPVIALVGDGAMQMNGINELITVARHWSEWDDPRLVVAVLNNHDLNQVTWEMRAMQGAPQFLPSQQLPDFPYADYARGLGFAAAKVEDPAEVGGAWQRALTADRPCVLEFVTDPAVPPIPPHATWDQIENMTESVLRGDTDRWQVLKEGVKSKAQEILPGRR